VPKFNQSILLSPVVRIRRDDLRQAFDAIDDGDASRVAPVELGAFWERAAPSTLDHGRTA
jgi:hypothetical protein